MPRLPSLDDLGQRPTPVSRRGVASTPNAGAIGQAIEGLGRPLFEAGQQMVEKEDRLSYAAAKTEILKADVTARAELEKDPDFEGWEPKYQARMKAARERAAAMIRSSSDRKLFEADAGVDVLRGASALASGATIKRNEARKATLYEALAAHDDIGLNATDDATREANLTNISELINAGVAGGYLSPVEAVNLRKQKTESYVSQRAENLVMAGDFDGAEKWINANAGRLDAATETSFRARIFEKKEYRENLGFAEAAVRGPVAPPAPGGKAPAVEDARPITQKMLRDFEGFREGAYWDVNHQRVGFGSDTITTADGKVRTVRAGDRVSRADAERDLARRTRELEKTAAARAGKGWDSLPSSAKAAVLSVAYNYGADSSRLKPLWEAAGKSDAEAVAKVITGLSGDNGGVNRERRLKEAEAARSGGAQQAPQEHDLNAVYANIDAQADALEWSPEKREAVKQMAARMVERDENLLRRAYDDANDSAAQIILGLGDKFTDVEQLPKQVRDRMDPVKLAERAAEARANRDRALKEANAEPKPNGPEQMRLNQMRYLDPGAFMNYDLSQISGKVSRAELDHFISEQAKLRKGSSEWTPLPHIGAAYDRGASVNGLKLRPDQEVAVKQIMEDEAAKLFQTRKGAPLSDGDYDALFRSATRNVVTVKSGIFGESRGAKPRYDLTPGMVPDRARKQIIDAYKATHGGREPSNEDIARAYRSGPGLTFEQ